MGKGKRKHFDMGSSKWNPLPKEGKVTPETLVKTVTSGIPVMAKDSKGKTIVGFPSVSVSPFQKEADTGFPSGPPQSVLDVAIDAEVMDENDTRITPTKENLLFVQSFLRSIKRRFKFLIRQLQNHATQIGNNTQELTRVDELVQKLDSDMWDLRMEFDALNSKMDAIIQVFEGWGVPLDTFSSCSDTPPLDYGTEDGQNDVSGADVAKMVKAEEAQRKAKRIAASNEKTIDKFLKEGGNKAQGKTETKPAYPINNAADKVSGYYGRSSVFETETPKTFPLPPTDQKKTDKTNTKSTYGKGSVYHYCDMCKFSATELAGSRCKHAGSGHCGDLTPKNHSVKCDVYQLASATTSPKTTEIFGFDFSDEKAVSH